MAMTATLPLQAASSLQPAFVDAVMTGAALVVPHFDVATMYSNALRNAPLETKVATAAGLACVGDAFAQRMSSIHNEKSMADGNVGNSFLYDVRRGMAFAAFGACYTGAFQHFWFNWLNDHLVGVGVDLTNSLQLNELLERIDVATGAELLLPQPSPELLAAFKVAINQFCVVPILYMPLFFWFTGVLAGLNPEASLERARELYSPILRRNYAFWLPTQFLVFFTLPQDYQVPILSAASLVWTVILSSLGSDKVSTSLEEVEYLGAMAAADASVTVEELTDTVTLEDVTSAAGAIGAQGGLVAAGFAIAGASGSGKGAADALVSLIDGGTQISAVGSALQDVLLDAQAIPLALALGSASEVVSDAAVDLVGAGSSDSDDDAASRHEDDSHAMLHPAGREGG